ncbi:flagellar motor switch protein FliN [Achromobacter marplatensis]|jgi:flagellar motor switch protein FliN/FliY|uniref:Flagellar motor switch protein FliN n=1 Tax=Achromobacter marplatensis TaxID=470868 RepID=J4QSQ9_9BURK|nr:flagellar motor switch protein FliN [Achromobacter marplatensis]EJO31140.1 flagellar motor switch protein FliN [Achromobacter marplatensis]MDH2053142.1 flagellar motor switch protein FliN [Achromobacter marplatensis]OWT69621.1 flagellar motor switch protein FliN [Achromobacter marplatensis]RBP23687.1 flagellar motor switch protein FliN/FliY [Achromobacter marplatensis]CAB3630713.1 Flagellar motor switch protein FliN [Achromobacter marplatensis]
MTDKNEPGTGSSPADDWADALAEQSRANPPTQADGLKPQDDWAAAMAEQSAATPAAPAQAAPAAPAAPAPAPAKPAAQSAAQSVFKPLAGATAGAGTDIDLIMDVPVQLTVELGRTRLTIKNLLQLGQGSVVELDGLAGEPMDIFVNGYLIAQGEVVVVEDKYGIRLTDIITPSERINRLNNRR